MDNKLKSDLYSVLKQDPRLWNEETKEFNETFLKDLVDKLDENLIGLLLSDDKIKEQFFIQVKGVFVLKQNDLKFFIDENKLDNSFTQYKSKIGLRVGNKLLTEREEIVLEWPFKDCVLEGGMTKEDQKRNEIFFNEILAKDEIDRLEDPKALVNWKRHTVNGDENITGIKKHVDGIIKENLIIKGNNLLGLHCLLEVFSGRIKLIYIDPPFAKDADTFYNDNFKRSTWLVFMKNRLEIAKKLLHKDGGIFIHIDDKHQPYLRVLCDEVFGEENFVNTIVIKSGRDEGVKMAHKEKKLIKFKEYILFYAKNKQNIKLIPQYKEKIKWDDRYDQYLEKDDENDCRKWRIITISQKLAEIGLDIADKEEVDEWKMENADRIVQLVGHKSPAIKSTKNLSTISELKTPKGLSVYAVRGKKLLFASNKIKEINGENRLGEYLGDLWTDISYNNLHNEGGVDLPNGKKPEELIGRIIDLLIGKDEEAIVLDYHLGCGTTAAVCHKKGIQYIGLEQIDYGENDSVVRLNNVIQGDNTGISQSVGWKGGGSFISFELAKWNQKAKENILQAKSYEKLIALFNEMYEVYFINYNVKAKEFTEKIIHEEGFRNLTLDEHKKLFIEMLDQNQLYINFSERADKKYNLSEDDIRLSEEFYNSNKQNG